MTPRKKKKINIFNIEPIEIGGAKKNKNSYRNEWIPDEQYMDTEKVEMQKMPKIPIYIYYPLIIIVALVFVFKLTDLQITHGQEHRLLAEDNRIRSHLIEAPRGQIVDSSGEEIVGNAANYVFQIYPYNLPKDESTYYNLIEKIQKVIKIDEDLNQTIQKARSISYDPVVLKEGIERNEAMDLRIQFLDEPGVEIAALPKRQYNTDLSISHLVGYVGKMTEDDINTYPEYSSNSLIGKTGVEAAYDEYLRGVPGEEQVEIDSAGRLKRTLKSVSATTGDTLKLHLVSGLQKVLQDELKSAIEKSEGKSGVAIALDPRDGGILAMVSLPDFDLNIFSGRIAGDDYQKLIDDENLPLLNRAIGGLFPPGSSIKPFVASGALDAGIIDENTTILTPPEIKIGEWIFPDWKPHGSADVKRAIAESNNIFFYALGGGYDKISGLGSERLKHYLEKFGFGDTTGIDIAGEQSGLVPDAEWKEEVKGEKWYVGDTYHMSIGQGDLLVTPMEMAAATTAIANGGTLYEPRAVSEIISAETGETVRKVESSIKSSEIINGDSLRIVREGMRQTITSGSGYSTFGADFPIEVAGKTGTAQFGTEDKTHAWFTSFAPYNDPKISITVFVESGGEGYETAAPVAKAALTWYSQNTTIFD